jgi:hypothetical protein
MSPSPFTVEELVTRILIHRRVTRDDQQLLKFFLLYGEGLDEQERTLIDRVLYGIRHGLLQVSDSVEVTPPTPNYSVSSNRAEAISIETGSQLK